MCWVLVDEMTPQTLQQSDLPLEQLGGLKKDTELRANKPLTHAG